MPDSRSRTRYPSDVAVLLVFLLLALLTLVGAAVVIAVLVGKASEQRRMVAAAPRSRAEALVVDKRAEISGGGERPTTQRYFVTFEFADGNRAELSVSGSESGMLTPGDRGTLEWQGRRFVGFARQILR